MAVFIRSLFTISFPSRMCYTFVKIDIVISVHDCVTKKLSVVDLSIRRRDSISSFRQNNGKKACRKFTQLFNIGKKNA